MCLVFIAVAAFNVVLTTFQNYGQKLELKLK